MSPAKPKQKSSGKTSDGWTDAEREAMKERAREMKAEARRGKKKAEGEKDLLAKIAEMPKQDRVMAERLHAIVKASAPGLAPKTWYGMPAYANDDGKVVCNVPSATLGSTRAARRAGIQLAASATAASTAGTRRKVAGSVAATP